MDNLWLFVDVCGCNTYGSPVDVSGFLWMIVEAKHGSPVDVHLWMFVDATLMGHLWIFVDVCG